MFGLDVLMKGIKNDPDFKAVVEKIKAGAEEAKETKELIRQLVEQQKEANKLLAQAVGAMKVAELDRLAS